jgi:restriction system protein
MWLTLKFMGGTPFPLLNEPANSQVFWGIGTIILFIWVISLGFDWLKRRRDFEKVRELNALQSISPEEFEELVAETFRRQGHHAKVAGQTGDHGIDVRVRALNGEKWVVQCKRYKGTVGEPIVRDLYGTMLHEKAHRAPIVTSGIFSRQALTWAEDKPIDLYDGEAFLKILSRLQSR